MMSYFFFNLVSVESVLKFDDDSSDLSCTIAFILATYFRLAISLGRKCFKLYDLPTLCNSRAYRTRFFICSKKPVSAVNST